MARSSDPHFEHLLDVLTARREQTRRGIYTIDGRAAREHISYANLIEEAHRVSAALARVGLTRGDRIVLMMPTGQGFLKTFFGAILLGAAIIPITPPRADHPNPVGSLRILSKFARRVGARAILYDDHLPLEHRPSNGPASTYEIALSFTELLADTPLDAAHRLEGRPPELAYIQPTAGSTGPVRAVALTHANILSSVHAMGEAMQITQDDIGVSWLPLDNIMSLVGFVCFSLYWDLDVVIIDPRRFLEKPHEWLWAIHQHRATITSAPDFAYYHCLRRARERDLDGLDLSSLRIAMSGGQQVRARHIKGFVQRFQHHGLDPDVFLPVYGLTEGTLAVTVSSLESRLSVDVIDRRALEYEGKATPIDPEGISLYRRMHLVSVGVPLDGIDLRIQGSEGAERVLGEIAFRGKNIASGYINTELDMAEHKLSLTEDGWLATGDLGYIADGKLFVIDRAEDSPVLDTPDGPRRIFPSEAELLIDAVDGVRAGASILLATDAEDGTSPKIIVAYEVQIGADDEAIEEQVSRLLQERLDIKPDRVLSLSPSSTPKTRDGKVRRAMARRFFTEERLERGERGHELEGIVRLLNRARSDVLRISEGMRRRISRLLERGS
jgi:acyl-CoA synthetase (AMP-forming)/AMP-acid ligase II